MQNLFNHTVRNILFIVCVCVGVGTLLRGFYKNARMLEQRFFSDVSLLEMCLQNIDGVDEQKFTPDFRLGSNFTSTSQL